MNRRLLLALGLSTSFHVMLATTTGKQSTGSSTEYKEGAPISSARGVTVRLGAPDRARVAGNESPLPQNAPPPSLPREKGEYGNTQEKTAPSLFPIFPKSLADKPDVLDGYLPTNELTVPPTPESPIVIQPPEHPDWMQFKGHVTLVLYIGESGVIDKIHPENSNLPASIEKLAIDTFQNARMRAGEKNGQPRKAKMKILVEFEAL